MVMNETDRTPAGTTSIEAQHSIYVDPAEEQRLHEEWTREEAQEAQEQREGPMFDGNYPVQNALPGEEGSVVG